MAQDSVFEVTAGNFMSEVVEASAETPTLVDFWAPWCGPCKQLMPVLDRLAAEYSGRLKLAKVNTDEQQELAAQIGIRSLPTVVLFKDRTAVDHFVGVVPEAQIRELLERHLPRPPESPLERAQALRRAGDLAAARTVLEQALRGNAGDVALRAELAEVRALDGDLEGARADLSELQGAEPNHAAVKRLEALLTFSDLVGKYPNLKELKDRAAASGDLADDLQSRHALAVHQLLAGDVEPALRVWLDMLRNQPTFGDGLARKSLVLAFELIGEADPIVAQTRREMARILF